MITGSWVRDRGFTVPRLVPRRLRSLHTLAIVLLLLFVGWIGWLWYRSSSFVKVGRVAVTGLSGPDVPQIRDGLTSAALQMTTLHMNISKLEATVAQYAYVQSLTVTRRGAHGVVIHVDEQVPVALVNIGGNDEVVDADGRLLPNSTIVHGALPIVPVASAPAGTTITEAGPRAAIAALGRAIRAASARCQRDREQRSWRDRAAAQRTADLFRTELAAAPEVGGGCGGAAGPWVSRRLLYRRQ
jgi:cell division septal protein FtsQ